MNDNVTWFKHAKYGMMIHWGLYSLLAGEYRGESSSAYAEWIQSKFQIPNVEYGKLATAFNPLYFDADQIVALAKSAVCSTWSSPPNTTTALPCIIQRLTATTYTTPPRSTAM